MKKNSTKMLMLFTIVTIVGFGAYAFADWGGGWGHQGRGGPGYGYGSDLNEDEYKKLDEERQAFFKETENLRQDIYEKELALERELTKESPDAKKAAKLHKELAELETRFEQKQIDHHLAVRKINPRMGRGYMGRGGIMGYGRGGMMGSGRGGMMGSGRGGMMGYGRGGMMGYGPGGCW